MQATNNNIAQKADKVADLGSCTFYRSGQDFYIRGADSVVKKLGSVPIRINNFRLENSKYDGKGASTEVHTFLQFAVTDYTNATISNITTAAYNFTVSLYNADTSTLLLINAGSVSLINVNNIKLQIDFSSYSYNPAWLQIGEILIN